MIEDIKHINVGREKPDESMEVQVAKKLLQLAEIDQKKEPAGRLNAKQESFINNCLAILSLPQVGDDLFDLASLSFKTSGNTRELQIPFLHTSTELMVLEGGFVVLTSMVNKTATLSTRVPAKQLVGLDFFQFTLDKAFPSSQEREWVIRGTEGRSDERDLWIAEREFHPSDIYSHEDRFYNFVRSVDALLEGVHEGIDKKYYYSKRLFNALTEANQILQQAMAGAPQQ